MLLFQNQPLDNNPDNITLKDYKITNLTTIQTSIKNMTSKQELELKFEITYSVGDKSYKTAKPITITHCKCGIR